MRSNLFLYSLRKSSSDLSCKSFTEIVGSGTIKKPLISSGGVKKILDRRLKAMDGYNNTNKTNKSSFKLLKDVSIIFPLIFIRGSFCQ